MDNSHIYNEIDIMKKFKVIISGCCRDVERYISKNVCIMHEIGKKFGDYQIIIYENDSKDNTRSVLNTLKTEKIDYIFEDNLDIPSRTMRIAHCRNKILEHIRKTPSYMSYDYLLMLDLDDILYSGALIDTIHHCFSYKTDQWDAMFANCSDKYYDIYALRKKGVLTTCCWNDAYKLMTQGIPRNIAYEKCVDKYIINYPTNTGLIPVTSAFGGAGLYKLNSLENVWYNGYEETHLDKNICEHVPLNVALKKKGCKLYINPKMLVK